MYPEEITPDPRSRGPMVPEAMVRAPPASDPWTAPEATCPELTAPDARKNREMAPEEIPTPCARWNVPICPEAMLPDRTPPEAMCGDPI